MFLKRCWTVSALLILTSLPAMAAAVSASDRPGSSASDVIDVGPSENRASTDQNNVAESPAKSEEIQVAALSKKSKNSSGVSLKASINLATQTMTVSENGYTKYSWKISSGTRKFPTPRGTFSPKWKAKMWYSRKYDMAPMPHSVFIHGGVAIHGTGHVGSLGSPASHGCIRLSRGNARTFYNLVSKHGNARTRVSIYGSPKFYSPVAKKKKKYNNKVAKRRTRIIRDQYGRKRRVYVAAPPPSYYDDYYFGSW